MNTVKGDLIALAKQGQFDIIVQGCNCFCTMGAGIAATIKKEFPEAYLADCKTMNGDINKLGTYTSVTVYPTSAPLIIINAYTQYGHQSGRFNVDYDAIRNVFKKINKDFQNKIIGIPKIGAGLAGGDWAIIEKIIDEESTKNKVTVVEFVKV